MQKRLECKIFGRVHLVMFRDFVCRKGQSIGLTGTVKNDPDGAMSVVAEGDEAKLRELLALIHRGPILARVDRVEEIWTDYLGNFQSFDILY